MKLEDYGWNRHFQEHFRRYREQNFSAGRVISEIKNHYRLLTESGEIPARGAGSMFYRSHGRGDLPVVGDWVVFKLKKYPEPMGRIHHILPRISKFSRKIPGKTVREQPVAANIDTIFIMAGLDDNFNLRRLERYLSLACDSGANPVVILNKSDLCPKSRARFEEATAIANKSPVHVLSALHKTGLEQLGQYLKKGRTVAVLGSSGVGKSTLLNSLFGKDVQEVQELGQQSKGRHTTRMRELFVLPDGAMIIDTPGMREIQLWNVEDGLSDAFSDIDELSVKCRFADCRHINEPDCKVKDEVDSGKLPRERYENYLKLQEELKTLEDRQDTKAIRERMQKAKRVNKSLKKTGK